MSVRIGVDVGGTFTKAVACDPVSHEIVARAIVPTTHGSAIGVSEGVADAIGELAEALDREGLGPVALVSHSTTQAVNALLEGDTATVGVLGIGRRPDLRRTRNRTSVGDIRLAPGHRLRTLHAFVDVTAGVDRDEIERAVRGLIDGGAQALAISEAFGVDDPRAEWLALEIAGELGVPACAGHELTGLYGLEMRTVTAALNASILPTALGTASVVEDAVAARIGETPLLVMRGDGGAADIRSLKRHPILTAFSGPAASIAGALRYLSVTDGVVVEVGGTSTNVSIVKGGRPVLAYIRVLEHVTCVRSLDVRVVGVAGGSLIRMRRSRGRLKIADVGPRSAHISGLRYCAFVTPGELDGARAVLAAPKPEDADDHVVIETTGGERFALTVTCAANALDRIPPDAYAAGDQEAARMGFEALARETGVAWEWLAEKTLEMAAHKIAAVVREATLSNDLAAPTIIGLGGGAGALIPMLSQVSQTPFSIPVDAEVISSVGDALSLVRVEVERGMSRPTPEALAELQREAEAAAVDAGASPETIQIETEAITERRAMRITATGSVALDSGAGGAEAIGDQDLAVVAKETLDDPALVLSGAFYTVFTSGQGRVRDFAVIDRRATIAVRGRGVVLTGPADAMAGEIRSEVTRMVRHLGPVSVAPAVTLLRGARLIDLSLFSDPNQVLEAVSAGCADTTEQVAAFLVRG